MHVRGHSVCITYTDNPGKNKIMQPSLKYLSNNVSNGTAHFKMQYNCLNTNIHSYIETSGCQSSNLYLNVVHFFNTWG